MKRSGSRIAVLAVVTGLAAVGAAAPVGASSSSARLVSYSSTQGSETYTLTVARNRSALAKFSDSYTKKNRTRSLTLSITTFNRLSAKVKAAGLATAKRHFTATTPITCGVSQTVTSSAGRRISIDAGASTPTSLTRLLTQLSGIAHTLADSPKATASLC